MNDVLKVIADDFEKIFLIHYQRIGNIDGIRRQRSEDISSLLDLGEYSVKENVIRRSTLLILICSVVTLIFGDYSLFSRTASEIAIVASLLALILMYSQTKVTVVIALFDIILISISWMDFRMFSICVAHTFICLLYSVAKFELRKK